VRAAVRENRLVSRRISDEEVPATPRSARRGWVIEVDGAVVAFAIGDATIGNIWALFVDPAHERRVTVRRCTTRWSIGFGRRGCSACGSATESGHARRTFLSRAGWRHAG